MKIRNYSRLSSRLTALCIFAAACSSTNEPLREPAPDPSLQAESFSVRYVSELDSVVFEIETAGNAASFVPPKAGQLDGAPVTGYVFPTTLGSSAVGFGAAEGTVALAVTSHPDFDDTPLWDEDSNAKYDDDGAVYHAHWVLLREDERAPAGLAVAQSDESSTLPPTAPMPMYLDSPGFTVIEDGSQLRVVVPADRIQRQLDFSTTALTADMRVDASDGAPLLAVERVLSQIGSGTPDTPVANASSAPASAWPSPTASTDTFDITATNASYDAAHDTFVLSMDVAGAAAVSVPTAAGRVDGAPVVGYVFPTSIPPATVGFLATEGTLALAVTSHPDFDDTPNWDENFDNDYANDGATYHVHWVVLTEDSKSGAGLSVASQSDPTQLPPTAPMPMYLDSPGYHAFASGGQLRVLVPGWHLRGVSDFSFDAVTANMRVDTSSGSPVLRVEEVIEVLSGDLSLPNSVSKN